MKMLMRREMKGQNYNMQHFKTPLQFPHDPSIQVTGVIPEESSVFKSSVKPMKVMFRGKRYPKDWNKNMPQPPLENFPIMFKNGDDMRQDQLVLSMIKLIDSFLQDVGLDFKFTAYDVLAHSIDDGIMEFVPSQTV